MLRRSARTYLYNTRVRVSLLLLSSLYKITRKCIRQYLVRHDRTRSHLSTTTRRNNNARTRTYTEKSSMPGNGMIRCPRRKQHCVALSGRPTIHSRPWPLLGECFAGLLCGVTDSSNFELAFLKGIRCVIRSVPG